MDVTVIKGNRFINYVNVWPLYWYLKLVLKKRVNKLTNSIKTKLRDLVTLLYFWFYTQIYHNYRAISERGYLDEQGFLNKETLGCIFALICLTSLNLKPEFPWISQANKYIGSFKTSTKIYFYWKRWSLHIRAIGFSK